MKEQTSVVLGIGGMDEYNLMVDLIKLLKGQYLTPSGEVNNEVSSTAATLLAIRALELSETERLTLAYLYGKHVGASAVL